MTADRRNFSAQKVSGVGILATSARVAELVDATDLKSVIRKGVWVRFPPRAPLILKGFSVFLSRREKPQNSPCDTLVTNALRFLVISCLAKTADSRLATIQPTT
jgi:hypothetical protein